LEFMGAAGNSLGIFATVGTDQTGAYAFDQAGLALPNGVYDAVNNPTGTVSIRTTTSNGTARATGIAPK